MKLSDDDVERALYCVNETVDRRRRAGIPVPGWMMRLGRLLDLASLTSDTAARGHETGCSSEQSEEMFIGSVETARLLGLSTRQVRRLRGDLEGESVSGRLVFRAAVVNEYAEMRHGRNS